MDGQSRTIYTDGGFYENIGTWAWVGVGDDPINPIASDHGYEIGSTNNRMEMMAIINGVRSFPPGTRVNVVSDSGYIVTGYTNPAYLKKWMTNGWKTSKKQPVENQDLWSELIIIGMMYDINYKLIKGHQREGSSPDAHWNNLCDKMCTAERGRVKGMSGIDSTASDVI